jgi:hypothetical protein
MTMPVPTPTATTTPMPSILGLLDVHIHVRDFLRPTAKGHQCDQKKKGRHLLKVKQLRMNQASPGL